MKLMIAVSRRRIVLILTTTFLAFLAGIFGYFLIGHAETAYFYPSACLGTFENPHYAQGQPETIMPNTTSTFSIANSAVAKSVSLAVFCGNFIPADTAVAGNIQAVNLLLVWQATSSSLFSVPEPENITTPVEKTSVPAVATSSAPTEEATSTTFFHPQKWLGLIRKIVHAEENSTVSPEDNSAVASSIPAAMPLANPDVLPVADATDFSSSTMNEISTTTPVIDERFLKVSYSLDGKEWFEVRRVGFNSLLGLTVTIPVNQWDALKTLQVSVEEIPTTLDPPPLIFLDGMIIDVRYTNSSLVEERIIKLVNPAADFLQSETVPLEVISVPACQPLPMSYVSGHNIYAYAEDDMSVAHNDLGGAEFAPGAIIKWGGDDSSCELKINKKGAFRFLEVNDPERTLCADNMPYEECRSYAIQELRIIHE